MDPAQIYIFIAVAALANVAVLVLFGTKSEKAKRLSPLAGLAFGLILAGLIFWDSRLIGYGLMGAGVVVAIVDMIMKSKKK